MFNEPKLLSFVAGGADEDSDMSGMRPAPGIPGGLFLTLEEDVVVLEVDCRGGTVDPVLRPASSSLFILAMIFATARLPPIKSG